MRTLYIDRGVGETRGVLAVDGRAHRLLIARDVDPASQRLGARSVARVARLERGLKLAFLAMADGPGGLLPLTGEAAALAEGEIVEVEVTAEPRADKPGGGKAAVLGLVSPAEGAPRLVTPGPDISARLLRIAPAAALVEGAEAREACDAAQDEALSVLHPLPGGGTISLEPTRALTAVDVDLGGRSGGDARRLARQGNLAAIAEAARLLRLKGLGGLVVIDLAGKGHDGAAFTEAARKAFADDGPGVAIGTISRFGLFELCLPRASTPVADRLLDEDGRLSADSAALALLRALEREGRTHPGDRLIGVSAPDVIEAAGPYQEALAGRIGARFQLEARADLSRRFEARRL